MPSGSSTCDEHQLTGLPPGLHTGAHEHWSAVSYGISVPDDAGCRDAFCCALLRRVPAPHTQQVPFRRHCLLRGAPVTAVNLCNGAQISVALLRAQHVGACSCDSTYLLTPSTGQLAGWCSECLRADRTPHPIKAMYHPAGWHLLRGCSKPSGGAGLCNTPNFTVADAGGHGTHHSFAGVTKYCGYSQRTHLALSTTAIGAVASANAEST
jgi:hypothetical protein